MNIVLPKNWTEITISQFIDVHNACTQPATDDIAILKREVNVLAALSGLSAGEIKTMPLEDFKNVARQLSWVADFSVLQNIPLAQTVKFEGVTYDVCHRMNEITAAQFIDLSHFTKTPDAIIENMHNILAVLLIPRTKDNKKTAYDGSNHKEIAELFYAKLPVAVAYPLAIFFCRLLPHLQKTIEHSSVVQLKKTLKLKGMERTLQKKLKRLTKDGDGMPPLTPSATTTAANGTIS